VRSEIGVDEAIVEAYNLIIETETKKMIEGFKMVAVQEITVTGPVKAKGSNRIAFNYDLNGVPFGAVYTFKAKGEVHPFHAVKSNGEHLGHFATKTEADVALRSEM
jgi:hypothetical protein